ncbi:MAG: SRPBCC family protein [Chitinophagales bacterium]|nr:SRPBCC family protein [Bacteroidota bacterium]
MNITISTTIQASIEKVWDCWTLPEHIVNWNFASPDWHAPAAENDLREGGEFIFTMAARDGSVAFDFNGIYTLVEPHKLIEYRIADGRKVSVQFLPEANHVVVTETFETENENSAEMQEAGWQAILDNFKNYVEQL